MESNMSKKKETNSKLRKYMKVTLKMVVKARDLYIKSMNQLSSHDLPGAGMAFGIPMVNHVSALPRSFSTSHAQISMREKDDRVAELVRSASARSSSSPKHRTSENLGQTLVKNMTVDTQRGPSKFQKAKSMKSCGGDHDHRFEKIDEMSPLISFGSNKKMLLRSKSYNIVKYMG